MSSAGCARDVLAQPRAHDLGVPRPAEHLAEPLELRAQGLDGPLGEQRPERRERAAQPPGGDAHLVDGVLGVQPHVRVGVDQLLPICSRRWATATAPTGPLRADLDRRDGRGARRRRGATRARGAPSTTRWPAGHRPSRSVFTAASSSVAVARRRARPRSRATCSRVSSSPMASAVTASSATTASTVPSSATRACSVRPVSMRATGSTAAPRRRTRERPSSAGGTVRTLRPGARRTSSRPSSPAGSLRCQPASDPPVRRRRLVPERVRRRSGLSR